MGAIPSIPLLDIKITAFYAMKAARSGESLPSFVTTETEAAAERLEAHHRLVTFIIWAIPTLGFIGTVLGIGQSLLVTLDIQSAFKYLRSTAEGRVATEIGVAFDTTLVALFLSFFLMLAYHLVQRGEDQMLSREKRDALRDLLTINNVRPPPTADDLTDQIARFSHSVSDFTAIQTALARQVQILEVLNKNTDLSIGSRTPKVLIGILVIAVVTTALLVISPDSFRWVFSNMTQ